MKQDPTARNKAIHDVVIRSLARSGDGLDLYRYQDHLLPRIGLIQYRQLASGQRLDFRLRPRSDELWILVEGSCSFVLHDLRSESPTQNLIQEYSADTPTLILVPFGVAFGARSETGCQLLRIATHDQSEDGGGKTLPWPEQ